MACIFILLIVSLDEKKFLNFFLSYNVVLFIGLFVYSVLSYSQTHLHPKVMKLLFCVTFQKCYCFASHIYICSFLDPIFGEDSIHCQVSVFHMDIPFPQHRFSKVSSLSSSLYVWPWPEITGAHVWGTLFSFPLFCLHTRVHCDLLTVPLWQHLAERAVLPCSSVRASWPCLLLTLCIPVWTWESICHAVQKSCCNFDRICIGFVDQFEENWHHDSIKSSSAWTAVHLFGSAFNNIL